MPRSEAALPRMNPTAKETVWSKEPRRCSTCWFRVDSWSRRGPRTVEMSPKCVKVCSNAVFSDWGATCGEARPWERPGGSFGFSTSWSGVGVGEDSRVWPGSGGGVSITVRGGELEMRWASAAFVVEELNLSAGAGSAFSAASGSSAPTKETRGTSGIPSQGSAPPRETQTQTLLAHMAALTLLRRCRCWC